MATAIKLHARLQMARHVGHEHEHLRTRPGCEGLFPEPDEIPAPGPAQSDQEHLPGHPGVLQVEQPETASHSASLETSVDQAPGQS